MKETIQLLRDNNISTREKIDWLEDQIMKAEEQRIELKKKFEQHDFYGPKTPKQSDIEAYGDHARDVLASEWEDERRFLKRQLTNKENQLDTFRLKLKKYKNIEAELDGSRRVKNTIDHQQNRDWLNETFRILKNGNYPADKKLNDESIKEEISEVKGRGLSDNRVAKQVSILYRYKFGPGISPDHIKGIVIYNNR